MSENQSSSIENALSTIVDRRGFIKQLTAAGASLLAASQVLPALAAAPKSKNKTALFTATNDFAVVDTLQAKDFSGLLGGKIPGLSDKQLQAHFGLYKNYVDKTNMINQKLHDVTEVQLNAANAAYSEYRELIVERAFTHNGVALHELYFANLGQGEPSADLKKLLTRDFESFEAFTKQFVALGKAMRGWAMLGYDMLDGKLRTYGMDQHHEWVPINVYPILVMDVYEHAYMMDYGTARAKYLDVFMQNINWAVVNNRLLYAVHHIKTGPNATA